MVGWLTRSFKLVAAAGSPPPSPSAATIAPEAAPTAAATTVVVGAHSGCTLDVDTAGARHVLSKPLPLLFLRDHHVELHRFALCQGPEPVGLDLRLMHEAIFRAVGGGQEPKTFRGVEPLHRACNTREVPGLLRQKRRPNPARGGGGGGNGRRRPRRGMGKDPQHVVVERLIEAMQQSGFSVLLKELVGCRSARVGPVPGLACPF